MNMQDAQAIKVILDELHEAIKHRDEAEAMLKLAVSHLRAGKAQFAPNTTNSLVDDFIAAYSHIYE